MGQREKSATKDWPYTFRGPRAHGNDTAAMQSVPGTVGEEEGPEMSRDRCCLLSDKGQLRRGAGSELSLQTGRHDTGTAVVG